jgi:hypothetical protein
MLMTKPRGPQATDLFAMANCIRSKGGEMTESTKKKKRRDGQLTSLAGEFFVGAELLKRGLQTSLTLGHAKAIDLFAQNPDSGKTFSIQVRALSYSNPFPINKEKVKKGHVYVFVIVGKVRQSPQYFILRGEELLSHPERFGGRTTKCDGFPCILPKYLEPYRDHWDVFGLFPGT